MDGEKKVKYITNDDALIPSANRLKQGGYILMMKYNGGKKMRKETREKLM